MRIKQYSAIALISIASIHSFAATPCNEEARQAYLDKQYQVAIALADQCLHVEGADKAWALAVKGGSYHLSGDPETAIAVLSESLALVPAYRWPLSIRARVYVETGQLDAAIADYERLLELEFRREKPSFWVVPRLARVLKKHGSVNEAISHFNALIARYPDVAEIYHSRAQFYADAGIHALVHRDLVKAAELSKDSPAMLNSLAWTYATSEHDQLRDGERAVEYAITANELTKWKDVPKLDTLAAAYATAGDFERAVEYQVKTINNLQPGIDPSGYEERLALYRAGKFYVSGAKDTEGPKITLARGVNVVATATRRIAGQVTDDSGIESFTIGGHKVSFDASGQFVYDVPVAMGDNVIEIVAMDTQGNRSAKNMTVTRQGSAQVAIPEAVIQPGKYHALIIAVQDYLSDTVTDLEFPLDDANRLAQSLESYSFKGNIERLVNPTRQEVIEVLDQLSKKVRANDNLLIFYAGHGYWDEQFKQGYWLPADARQDSRASWISNATVRDYIRGIATKHTLLISDACFSGGIFKSRSAFNDAPKAVNLLYEMPSRKALTSGTLTEVPDKSVFVDYLVKRLDQNDNRYLPTEALFSTMRTAVINNSSMGQVPQYGEIREAGDEGGDFIFVRN